MLSIHLLSYTYQCTCTVLRSNHNAKQKHLGYKKVWGQSEATLQTGTHARPKGLISAEAQKLL